MLLPVGLHRWHFITAHRADDLTNRPLMVDMRSHRECNPTVVFRDVFAFAEFPFAGTSSTLRNLFIEVVFHIFVLIGETGTLVPETDFTIGRILDVLVYDYGTKFGFSSVSYFNDLFKKLTGTMTDKCKSLKQMLYPLIFFLL